MGAEMINEKKLHYMEFMTRETGKRHHTDAEDRLQYDLLKAGDSRAVEEGVKMFGSDLPGHLSHNEVRNFKYRFVACITLACRAAIAGGMDAERAYNISDLYILKMDSLDTVDEIKVLHAEMFACYAKEMAELDRHNVHSQPVALCLDYIREHLHERLYVDVLAEYVGLNSNYLSTLFKREMGLSVSQYILSRKIESAENMLKFTDITYAEIASILAFSSQSHFIRTFKKYTGLTPREYRSRNSYRMELMKLT